MNFSITYQAKTIEEFRALMLEFPAASPAPSAPVISTEKGECEKMYNAQFGKAFRFTRAQKEESAGMNAAELFAFREMKCAECLTTGTLNRNSGDGDGAEVPPVVEGDAGRGADLY